ncbi:HesA/MoeB/ThiF family protein [Paraburkholderia sp. MM6662-R1]|uniref:HesA/MoeB/ThiF family protein n=1 Tax=Paraburkholderia sp. MM6662-R1 TaxID=2991066 RepID=UPI003D19348A
MLKMSPENRDPSWFDRLSGIVPSIISDKRVAIVGCGSVGSFIADELARAGVGKFLLIDGDVVEWRNLTRTVYRHADVGMSKVAALGRHLAAIFPDIEVDAYAEEVNALRPALKDLLSNVDLVVSALDDPSATGIIDRYCYALSKPALFVGIYQKAHGGEVIAVVPGVTPCLGCATGGVRESLNDVTESRKILRQQDYATNKLEPQVALGSDIHFVCNSAVKVALSMLCAKDQEFAIHRFINDKLRDGVHYLMLSTEPDFYIFPHTHANAIGQYAFQSVWLKTTGRPDCPRCGDSDFREPPF